jgi:hypothetical protein
MHGAAATHSTGLTYGTGTAHGISTQHEELHGTTSHRAPTRQDLTHHAQTSRDAPLSDAPHSDAVPETHSQGQVKKGHVLVESVTLTAVAADVDSSETKHGMTLVWAFLVRLVQGPWFLVIYLALIGLIFLRHRHVRDRDYQNKHQDYRALAEGLRIQIFWRLVGLKDSVAEHYLGEQRGELEWIRNALRTWDFTTRAGEKGVLHNVQPAQGVKIVQEYWIRAQKEYFVRKAYQEHKEVERNERLIRFLMRISVALTAMLAGLLILPPLESSLGLPVPASMIAVTHFIENHWIHGSFMIATLMLAVSAGLLHGYNQQRAYSEHAKQCGRMGVLFDIADRHLQVMLDNGNMEGASALLRELGKEALAENGDWVLLHRERPLEIPQQVKYGLSSCQSRGGYN